MATIYTAFASEATVNEEPLEGLQSIEYREIKSRHDIGAIGTDERIAVYFGRKLVSGSLHVASANQTLDGLLETNTSFSLSVTLRHNDTTRNVSFDDAFLEEKMFMLGLETHGETTYTFTATRVREE
jgi:hypothetical protein